MSMFSLFFIFLFRNRILVGVGRRWLVWCINKEQAYGGWLLFFNLHQSSIIQFRDIDGMELVPHDVIEHHILERLDVETLVRFKSVSKQWKSTIQSPYFRKRQLIYHRRQSRQDPDVLLVSVHDGTDCNSVYEALRTLPVGSSSSSSVSAKIPTCWENKPYQVCNTSCDGLICLYDSDDLPSIVVSPATRWHRTFPPCNYQLVAAERSKRYAERLKRGEEEDDDDDYDELYSLLLDLVKTKSMAHTSQSGYITLLS